MPRNHGKSERKQDMGTVRAKFRPPSPMPTVAVAAAAMIGLSAPAIGAPDCPPRYSVQIIQPPGNCGGGPNHSVSPVSINSQGVVAGSVSLCGGYPRAFTWSEQTGFALIPTPPGTSQSWANAISDSGIVAGTFQTDTDRGFTFTSDRFRPLDLILWGARANALGVNSQNTAVGFFEGIGNLRACRWVNNGFLEDLAVGLPLAGTSQAVAVNEHGVITGYMGYTSYPPPNPHTFILNNDQITEVEVPFANAFGSQPSSINNKSHICGYLWVESPDYPY